MVWTRSPNRLKQRMRRAEMKIDVDVLKKGRVLRGALLLVEENVEDEYEEDE